MTNFICRLVGQCPTTLYKLSLLNQITTFVQSATYIMVIISIPAGCCRSFQCLLNFYFGDADFLHFCFNYFFLILFLSNIHFIFFHIMNFFLLSCCFHWFGGIRVGSLRFVYGNLKRFSKSIRDIFYGFVPTFVVCFHISMTK